MGTGLLPDVACVYLEARAVCRASERWGRMRLLIKRELGPGTPKMVIFLFCSALFGTWMYVWGGCSGGTTGAWPVD